MGRLIYSAIASLEGYIADADGKFDSAEPDAEVHAFVNELSGRRHRLVRAAHVRGAPGLGDVDVWRPD